MAESNGNQPVTRNELKEELRALEERFDARLDSLEERMIRTFTSLIAKTKTEILEKTQEQVRDAQTELLRGFEAFIKGRDVQFRKLRADFSNLDAATDLRLKAVEDRLWQIEKRLGPPPPPPDADSAAN
jgi:flagellar biosynthesis/type III secretory pathway protein FliH